MLKSDGKHMLGVNLKNIDMPLTHEECIGIFWCIGSYPTITITPKMWQPFVHVILKLFPLLFAKYTYIMGFTMGHVKSWVSKWASHFEIFDKNDIPKISFHFFYNKKGFKIIECHVQEIINHYMSIIRKNKMGGWNSLKNDNKYKIYVIW